MVLTGQFPEGTLNRVSISATVHAENLEIILVSATSHGPNSLGELSQALGHRCGFPMEGTPNDARGLASAC